MGGSIEPAAIGRQTRAGGVFDDEGGRATASLNPATGAATSAYVRGDLGTCDDHGERGRPGRWSATPCRRSDTGRGRGGGSRPCEDAHPWGALLVREMSRDARVPPRAGRSAGSSQPGHREAGKPVSRGDRAEPGEEPGPGASPARLAKHGGERFQGNAAIPFANVALGGCKQVVQSEPRLVTFIGRPAQDDEVVLAALGDE